MATRRGNRAKSVPDETIGPWTLWRETNRANRAIRWIETYCIVPKGYGAGKPMRLAKFQKRWLRKVLAPGVRSAVMQVGRGNGKSTLLAALALWAIFDPGPSGSPQVPIVATTVGQAIRSVYSVAIAMIDANPELADRCNQFTAIGATRVVVPSTHGEMFPIASDPDGLQGLDPSLAVCDELGFQPQAAWDALLLASGKRPSSLVVGIGTPGLDRENALWYLRVLVREGRALPGFHFTEYSADEGCRLRDERQWRKANPSLAEGFMDVDALRMAVETSPESAFRIFRLAQWVDGHESWLGTDGRSIWQATNDSKFHLEPGAPTWIGVDAAIKRDTTAVVCVQVRPDGRLHAEAKVWVPTTDEPIDLNDVMAYIRTVTKLYKVGAVAYDPRFLDWPAKVLYDEGIPMVEVSQAIEKMTPVIGDLYGLVREGGVTHPPDPLFESHVLNAIARPNERGFTLSKGKSRGHIDAAIALALAVDRVRNKKKPRPPVIVL